MIECNFKSKVKHHDNKHGCTLTPNEITCPGEENCVLYKIYKNTKHPCELPPPKS